MRKVDEEVDMKSSECQVNEPSLYCKVSPVGKQGKVIKSRNCSLHTGFALLQTTLGKLLNLFESQFH